MNMLLNKIKFILKTRYYSIINSIAFYPALLVLLFLVLSVVSVIFDFSETGKNIKSQLTWLSLKDPETARNIIVVIAGGIISLTVFSFSMVMIVLNQAASNMSNRVLNKLIGNRFQQVILGIYIGTIVYALFLLSTIRDIDSGIHIPAISTYVLIVLAIFDLFLFIYFLHYITQSVKYEVIIKRIFKNTMQVMQVSCKLEKEPLAAGFEKMDYNVPAPVSGVYEGMNVQGLLNVCNEYDCVISLLYQPGTFILEGNPFIKTSRPLPEEAVKKLQDNIYLNNDESIDGNFLYGFKQLTEIALKALSPGVNDPGTACLSLRSLFRLLSYRACFFPQSSISDEEHIKRIAVKNPDFEEIFKASIFPIWDYGKNDRIIQSELHNLLMQLQINVVNKKVISGLLAQVKLKRQEMEQGN
jgi:uncharacterized membrane protein